MESILASLLAPYQEYSTMNIFLEATAIIFGLMSVWFSKKNNIWVYPTGIVSTVIFVYLLYNWNLLGDMLINAYYFRWVFMGGIIGLGSQAQLTLIQFLKWVNGNSDGR